MAAGYVLDTDTFSYLIDRNSASHHRAHDRLTAVSGGDEIGVSVLSLYELHHWFAYLEEMPPTAEKLMSVFQILPLPNLGAPSFGALMRDLRAKAPKADIQRWKVDCMIAVTASSLGAVLVSSDRLFHRMADLLPGLSVVDWTA